ncbi:MAG: NnrS family protein [Gammaproteobacteria bacterium]
MLAAGFRPFFLCAGGAAVVLMAIWLLGYTKRDPLLTYYGSSGWHAHEMLFGYVVAVVAGFLLTAVRTWTNRDIARGLPLAALTLLWLAGRILPLFAGVPPWIVAVVDLAFLPLLAAVVAIPLIHAGQRGDLFIPALLLVLMLANVLVHSEWLGYAMDSARLGVVLAVYTLVLLITVIAGRVIPSFIENALPGVKIRPRPRIESMSVVSIVLLGLTDLFSPFAQVVVVCAVLAAVVHAWRLGTWLRWAVLARPLLWVLLVGYAWLVAGFALLAVAYSGMISNMLAFHALMAGGIGVLTLGMMARVALGHTGRPLRAPPLVALAFVLVNLAAAVRVVGPMLTLHYTKAVISAAGALWIAGFVLFMLVFTPILIHARVDSRPG